MPAGLYGKLVAKRDFIAVDLPPGFLQKWEPWLQGAVTGANLKLGGNWQRIFFTAPIWRFWLGREVLGFPAMGVLMPSVDGVGRQFPLCLIVPAASGRVFKPLFQDAQAAWFHEAEDFLLSTLEEGVPFELTLQRAKALRDPDSVFSPDLPEGVSTVPGGLLALTTDPNQIEMPLRLLQYSRLMRDEPGLSYWWTIGGDAYPPTSFAVDGLPDEALFLRMLQSPIAPAEIPYQPPPQVPMPTPPTPPRNDGTVPPPAMRPDAMAVGAVVTAAAIATIGADAAVAAVTATDPTTNVQAPHDAMRAEQSMQHSGLPEDPFPSITVPDAATSPEITAHAVDADVQGEPPPLEVVPDAETAIEVTGPLPAPDVKPA